MFDNPKNIFILTDFEDNTNILKVITELDLQKFQMKFVNNDFTGYDDKDILIIYPKDISSKIIRNIFKSGLRSKSNIAVIVENDAALMASSLSKMGFYNLFVLPHESEKLKFYLDNILNQEDILSQNQACSFNPETENFEHFIGNSELLHKAIETAKTVSVNPDVNILILGETGTGKSMLARAIHNHLTHSSQNYVEVTCTAIPEQLLESELFGYEKGAFTDARTRKPGLFEIAKNGTIFLDEIGDLSLSLQAKLLRVIEKKVIRRLGGVEDIPIQTRIISATNRNLIDLVEKGLFRIDLYYRLNVVTLELPPLRERKEDIIPISKYYIDLFSKKYRKQIDIIDKELLCFLENNEWKGNVRELKNLIERAVLLMKDNNLSMKNFENILKLTPEYKQKEQVEYNPDNVTLEVNFKDINLREVNKIYAKSVLNKMKGNKSRTAKILGVSRPKLDSLLNDVSN